MTTQSDLSRRARGYVTRQLTEATFQQFISTFESYFFDLLRLWLTAYPQSLGGRKVDFKAVLDAPDKDSITHLVISKELNEVLYERPAEWFAYLQEKVKLGCPSAIEIEQIAEAKATRDVLIHNRGSPAGPMRSRQAASPGSRPAKRSTSRIITTGNVWSLFRKLVSDLSAAAIAKVS